MTTGYDVDVVIVSRERFYFLNDPVKISFISNVADSRRHGVVEQCDHCAVDRRVIQSNEIASESNVRASLIFCVVSV